MPNKKSTLTETAMHLQIPTGPKSSGHEVDFGAFSIDSEANGNKYRPWIGKLNKHKGPKGVETSILETAFSELASLYIKPGLTPPAKIIVDDKNKVIGVASENYDAHILGLMANNVVCHGLKVVDGQWQFNKIKPLSDNELTPEVIQEILPKKTIEGINERIRNEGKPNERVMAIENTVAAALKNADAALKDANYGVNFVVDMVKEFFVEFRKKFQTELPKKPSEGVLDQEKAASALKNAAVLRNAHQGVKFLVDMPKDFIVDLLQKYDAKDVDIDMASLASVLTASFALEEDDLHKGNIGFYIITDPVSNKMKFTFFKIDHDLMLNNSIMSKKDMRITSIFYNNDSFNISVRDLEGFPHLVDSGNHYWPTQSRWTGSGNKQYSSAEAQAFRSLNKYDDFNNEKWASFLKYMVMPEKLVKESLLMHLDPVNDRDKINMVNNSAILKLQDLKSTLLQSGQFKIYLEQHGKEAITGIKKEIENYLDKTQIEPLQKEAILKEIDETCNAVMFSRFEPDLVKNTIRLNCYNFEAQANLSKEAIMGAIKVAQTKLAEFGAKDDAPNVFKYACIIQDLAQKIKVEDRNELNKNGELDKDIEAANWSKANYVKATEIDTMADFISAADKIREVSLPLKHQKNELLAVLEKSNLSKEDLLKLKADLNKKEPDEPSLKFVNQLRSNTWFMRLWHGGTYGKTSTAEAMIKVIDSKLKDLELSAGVKEKSEIAASPSKAPEECATSGFKSAYNAQKDTHTKTKAQDNEVELNKSTKMGLS